MHGALQEINDWELRMDGRTVVKFKWRWRDGVRPVTFSLITLWV